MAICTVVACVVDFARSIGAVAGAIVRRAVGADEVFVGLAGAGEGDVMLAGSVVGV